MANRSDDHTYISNLLRELRVSVGFSQQNVADVLNVNRSTYTYYETGKTMPDVPTLGKIARIFQVPVEIFYQQETAEPISLLDTNGKRRRSPKAVSLDPEKVGQLSPEEKQLIALLRSRDDVTAEETLAAVEKRLGLPPRGTK